MATGVDDHLHDLEWIVAVVAGGTLWLMRYDWLSRWFTESDK